MARGAEFAGAPLGSWLLVVASAAAAFWVNAWLFVSVSVVLLAMTRMAIPEEDALGQEACPDAERNSKQPVLSVWAFLRAGIRLIRGYRTLATLLIVVLVAELGFSGPMIAGVPLLANETSWACKPSVGFSGASVSARLRGPGSCCGARAVRHTGYVAPLSGLTAMGLSVVGLGLLPALGLPVSASLVCCGTPRPELGPRRRFLWHAGHVRCPPAGSGRSDRTGHECPVILQFGRSAGHLRPHRAPDRRVKRASPISHWGAP